MRSLARPLFAPLLLLGGGLGASPQGLPEETLAIPGTDFKVEMVRLPGGRFRMGSPEGEPGREKDEGPVREVEVKPFWISKHEVTWEAFERFFSDRKASKVDGVTRPSEPYEPPNGAMGTGRHPAVSMRWHGAAAFCEWLSALTGQRFRLPTEAEWEYAARAGTDKAAPEPLGDYAWTQVNGGDKTHEVGQKKPNAYGLYDMLGNVWEYCLEFADPPEYGPVLRGGGWHSPASELRFAKRQTIRPAWYERDPNRPRSLWWLTDATFVGFRVARFVDPAEKDAQQKYAAKVEIGPLTLGKMSQGNIRVSGAIKNAGDRPLDEVELTLYYLDQKGRPLFEDRKFRATWTKAWPVLANSARDGEHRKPLAPGASRAFEADVPQPFDYDVDLDKVGAKVSGMQFSKP